MRRRHLLAHAAKASLVGLCALPPSQTWAQIRDVNDAINQAGRQRMLSQRMTKAWLALVHQVQTKQAAMVLTQSVALFDKQLSDLRTYAPTPVIRATYAELAQAWEDQKRTLAQPPARGQAASLLAQDARVLALAHQGTVQYEAASGKAVGALVNLAGRQRMLSQRMAKFYLAATLPVQAEECRKEVEKARTEFAAAMETLRKAPQTSDAIHQELQLAHGQWLFFDAAVQRLALATHQDRQISDVFIASENMLSSMERVTNLFAQMAS